ncbi:hypothetical protein H5410_045898 [Solanum commersonii]|uniref:Uncharacterized protein n=1 Tax=Solanum commersonii TaxID=4109 RepID=A0A9J5XEZ6_SOLCO|nr:hypothetical protein H5410_045898 [Solanum commersonii]
MRYVTSYYVVVFASECYYVEVFASECYYVEVFTSEYYYAKVFPSECYFSKVFAGECYDGKVFVGSCLPFDGPSLSFSLTLGSSRGASSQSILSLAKEAELVLEDPGEPKRDGSSSQFSSALSGGRGSYRGSGSF